MEEVNIGKEKIQAQEMEVPFDKCGLTVVFQYSLKRLGHESKGWNIYSRMPPAFWNL